MTKTTHWPLNPHTKAKHIILRKYLDAWLPKITRFNGRVIFYDGFAGPGVYDAGEEGSPLIALRAFTEHTHRQHIKCQIKYFFVESRPDRFKSLEREVNALRPALPETVDALVLQGESDSVLRQILDSLGEQSQAIAPTFAFIDPFGVSGIPLDTVTRLMRHRSCEVMVNVMLGYLHRFVSSPEFEPHCDALFGCSDWREARKLSGPDRESFLRDLYQKQLMDTRRGVGARYVRRFTMSNEKARTIYDLFFATNHPDGIEAMKRAMWKVDDTGEYRFSDATIPGQTTLFDIEPDWSALIRILHRQFAGQVVDWPTVEEAVHHTPFRILKRKIVNALNQEEALATIQNPVGVRRNTLDGRTVIRFAP
jgi:three-Cys-motif partner protein